MSNPQHMAVAFLIQQQAEENNQTDAEDNARVLALFSGKPAKAPKAAKAPRAKREPVEETVKPKSAPPPWSTIQPGSVEATGFLTMMRKAADRQQKIEAIHAYVGYDMAGDFGTQEYRANAKAKLELKPIVNGAKAVSVMKGYVAGMPNPDGKFHHDLVARERMAVDTLCQNLQQAEVTQDPFDKDLKTGLAQVEAERIRNIRNERERALGKRHTIIGLG